ncbi:hypothetical protein QBC40DRAFT_300712 [Triangularia verruculosa]|uniref:Endonuclease III homolog n=1 Tax=Triangularia verruculosa TaxID=2587418 RepID=A0AAN6X8S0_9PEZI|nr:hypothetical protein QBC40DRAFT_300712 [Triangularia verruculosa]
MVKANQPGGIVDKYRKVHHQPKVAKMRTSRVARETARLFESASSTSTPLRRSSRTSTLAARFSYNTNASPSSSFAKVEESDGEDKDDVKMSIGSDIEDAITTTRAAKRRRTTATSAITTSEAIQSSPVRRTTRVKTERAVVKSEPASDSDFLSSLSDNEDIKSAIKEESKPTPRGRARKPARRITSPSGAVTIQPPSDWEKIYDLVKEMRINGPAANAAVDTMGCERLADPNSTVKDRRFHTLVALMLSSQTKDTVNAEAMKRLHTELPPFEPGAPVGLNLDNMLHCPPAVLNELIGKVGFHNNKTKYLLQTAQILKDKFNGDIPPTIEGLVSLPGVGPKMAHLCMSAENGWNRVEGIGVDVHVHRITNYWGWTGPKETKTPEETRMALQSWLPKDKWKEINWLLVGLGQSVCLPVGRRCGDCELGLKGLCKAADRKKVNEGKKRREAVKKEEEVVEKMEIDEDEEGGVVVKREEQRTVKTEVVDQGMPPPPGDVQPEPMPQLDGASNVAIPSVEQDVKPVIKDEEDVEVARSVPHTTSVKNEVDDLDDDMVKKEEEEDVEMADSPEVKVEVKTEPIRRRARIPAREHPEDFDESGESDAEVKVEVKPEPSRRRTRIPAHIPARPDAEVKVEAKHEVDEDDSEDGAGVKTEVKVEDESGDDFRFASEHDSDCDWVSVKEEIKEEDSDSWEGSSSHSSDDVSIKEEDSDDGVSIKEEDSDDGVYIKEEDYDDGVYIKEEDSDSWDGFSSHSADDVSIKEEDFDDSVGSDLHSQDDGYIKEEDTNYGDGTGSHSDDDVSVKEEDDYDGDVTGPLSDDEASVKEEDSNEWSGSDLYSDDEVSIKDGDSDYGDGAGFHTAEHVPVKEEDSDPGYDISSQPDAEMSPIEEDFNYGSDYDIERYLWEDDLSSDYGLDYSPQQPVVKDENPESDVASLEDIPATEDEKDQAQVSDHNVQQPVNDDEDLASEVSSSDASTIVNTNFHSHSDLTFFEDGFYLYNGVSTTDSDPSDSESEEDEPNYHFQFDDNMQEQYEYRWDYARDGLVCRRHDVNGNRTELFDGSYEAAAWWTRVDVRTDNGGPVPGEEGLDAFGLRVEEENVGFSSDLDGAVGKQEIGEEDEEDEIFVLLRLVPNSLLPQLYLNFVQTPPGHLSDRTLSKNSRKTPVPFSSGRGRRARSTIASTSANYGGTQLRSSRGGRANRALLAIRAYAPRHLRHPSHNASRSGTHPVRERSAKCWVERLLPYTRIKLQFYWMPRRKDIASTATPLDISEKARPRMIDMCEQCNSLWSSAGPLRGDEYRPDVTREGAAERNSVQLILARSRGWA